MLDADLGKLPDFCFEVSCGMLPLWFERKCNDDRSAIFAGRLLLFLVTRSAKLN